MLDEAIEFYKEGYCFPGEDIKPVIIYDNCNRIIRDYEPYYEITSFGRVWSIRKSEPKWLKPVVIPGKDYLQVCLCNKDGDRKTFRIHRLVLFAFVGPPDLFLNEECRHLDNNRQNNKLDNLEWATHIENCEDKLFFNTGNKGEKHSLAKLTELQIAEIRNLYKTGKFSYRKLGKLYGVEGANVYYIINNITWTHTME